MYDLIKDAERVADITSYRTPTSVWRHYERLTAFPEGFVVLGDAISSFNPFYGQGMSSAALQVRRYSNYCAERATASQGLEGLAQAFLPKAAEIVITPWTWQPTRIWRIHAHKKKSHRVLERGTLFFAPLIPPPPETMEDYRLLFKGFILFNPLAAFHEEPPPGRVFGPPPPQREGGRLGPVPGLYRGC